MKYLLMLYLDEKAGAAVPQEMIQEFMARFDAWSAAMAQAGVPNTFYALQPTSAATTARTQNGKKVTIHGPFAETKEQLGGFYLIEAQNLDQALEWALKCPGVEIGAVEVRPVR